MALTRVGGPHDENPDAPNELYTLLFSSPIIYKGSGNAEVDRPKKWRRARRNVNEWIGMRGLG